MASKFLPIGFGSKAGLSILLWACFTVPAPAQQPITIDGNAICSDCRIVLDSIAVLDGRRGDYVGEPLALARMSDGRWLLSAMHNPTQIAVFDPHGNLQRTVGREGNGPGEYQFIRSIVVGREDTIRIFDLRQRRLTVLTPDFTFVRSKRVEIPSVTDLELLPNGRIITVQDIASLERAGYPLHLVGRNGKIIQSFGAVNPIYRRDASDKRWRGIAPVPGRERVWVAHLVKYVLELWTYEGHRLKTLVRNVAWFQPHDDYGMDLDQREAHPNPGIVEIRRDKRGLIWVPIHVPDEQWEQGIGSVRGMYGQEVVGVSSPNDYFDTIVEIIRPDRARVFATARFDQKLGLVGETPYVWSYREGHLGFPFVHIWRLDVDH